MPTSGLKIVAYVDLGGPAVGDAALHGPEPAETYGVTLQVSGRDEEPAAEPGRERLDRRLCDVRDSQVGRGELVAEHVGDPCVDLDEVALESARENAKANDVEIEIGETMRPAALAVMNIALEVVEGLLPKLQVQRAITSGYLERDDPSVAGWQRIERRVRDGWAADLLEFRP